MASVITAIGKSDLTNVAMRGKRYIVGHIIYIYIFFFYTQQPDTEMNEPVNHMGGSCAPPVQDRPRDQCYVPSMSRARARRSTRC